MAKSRMRFAIGVGIFGSMLGAFFMMSSPQNTLRQAHHTEMTPRGIGPNGSSRNVPSNPNGAAVETEFSTPAHLAKYEMIAPTDSIIWIHAQQAWDWASAGEAILLDLRSYEDYQARHPQGARSYSAARLPDLEAAFPDKNEVFILMRWWNIDVVAIANEFHRKDYRRLCALDMNPLQNDIHHRSEWEILNLPFVAEKIIPYGNLKIELGNDEVLLDSLGQMRRLARFPAPTVDLLLRYRPQVLELFGYDADNAAFRKLVGEVESVMSAATVANDKIWVGFSFYEGERNEGYGGIGFYDLTTGETGVLRHPALVDHSVRDLMVTETAIHVATCDQFELSQEVGNGLVIIDRRTLAVGGLVPPGNSIVWHKDGGENVALYYDKPISEMLADRRFIPKYLEGWNSAEFAEASRLGLETYMIRAAEQELQKRAPLFSNMAPGIEKRE